MKKRLPGLLLQILIGLAAFLVGRFFTMPVAALLVFTSKSYAYGLLSVVVTVGAWEGSTQLYRAFRLVLFASLTPVQWVTLFSLVSGAYAVSLSGVAVAVQRYGLEAWLRCAPTPFKQLFLAVLCQVLLLVAVNGVRFFFHHWNDAQRLTADLTQATVRANYEALKNQVNPHFLFNSLSALTTLIYQDPDVAADFVTQLAKVYRYVLDSQRQELVPLATELEVVRAYAFLLTTRHGAGLVLDIDLPGASTPEALPPLSLQMLLENAVKHNRFAPEHPLRVRVAREAGALVVRNNVQPRSPPEPSTGLGLDNIRQRYALLGARPVEVTATARIFAVKLPLLPLLPPYDRPDSGRRAADRRTPAGAAAAL